VGLNTSAPGFKMFEIIVLCFLKIRKIINAYTCPEYSCEVSKYNVFLFIGEGVYFLKEADSIN
jgi:hypothetical protein